MHVVVCCMRGWKAFCVSPDRSLETNVRVHPSNILCHRTKCMYSFDVRKGRGSSNRHVYLVMTFQISDISIWSVWIIVAKRITELIFGIGMLPSIRYT